MLGVRRHARKKKKCANKKIPSAWQQQEQDIYFNAQTWSILRIQRTIAKTLVVQCLTVLSLGVMLHMSQHDLYHECYFTLHYKLQFIINMCGMLFIMFIVGVIVEQIWRQKIIRLFNPYIDRRMGSWHVACGQTSPISFASRGKGTSLFRVKQRK